MILAPHPSIADDLAVLNQVSRQATTPDFLRMAIRGAYRGRIALVASCGAGTEVLLHMIAGIDRTTTVIVADAQSLLPEARQERDALLDRLGLRDVRTLAPRQQCAVGPVDALERALDGFEAWIDGGAHAGRPLVEIAASRLRLNPLAAWRIADVRAYLAANDLPACLGPVAAASRSVH